ncbi:MAG: glycosyltransferase family 39 protein [Deltaproteobacteria bacterium]
MGKRARSVLLGAAATLVLVAAIDLTGLASLPFYSHGEPREAVVVQEMWRGNGLMLPLINGEIIPWKPPMFHWLGLAAASIQGSVTELAARLPSATLGILATLAVFLFGATISRVRSGWLAALILATSFEWIRASRTARVDMTLTFFLAGALLCFALLQHRKQAMATERGATWLRGLFWAFLAAGTLTKGPVALVLPMLVIGIWAWTGPLPAAPTTQPARKLRAGKLRRVLAELGVLRGFAVILPLVGIWYVAGWWIGGTEFLVRHALMENILRVLDAERLGSGHIHGPLYMVAHLFLGFLPWSFLAAPVGYWLWKERPLDETTRFLVVWFLVIFVFFLIPESKRGVYLLPAFPAMALLCGRVLGPGPEGDLPRRLVAWQCNAIAAFAMLISFITLTAFLMPLENLLEPILKPRDLQAARAALDGLRAGGVFTFAAAIAILGAAALVIWQARGAHWLRASFPMAALLGLLTITIALPAERGIAQARTLRDFARQAAARAGDAQLGIVAGAFEWGTLFYADRHLPPFKGIKAPPAFLIFHNEAAAEVPPSCSTILKSQGTGPKGRHQYFLARCD